MAEEAKEGEATVEEGDGARVEGENVEEDGTRAEGEGEGVGSCDCWTKS